MFDAYAKVRHIIIGINVQESKSQSSVFVIYHVFDVKVTNQ